MMRLPIAYLSKAKRSDTGSRAMRSFSAASGGARSATSSGITVMLSRGMPAARLSCSPLG